MTYLQLVNGVLRRLREDAVTSITDTAYSTMVGDYVNDAKRIVEDAWTWSAHRTTIDLNTVASTSLYSLTDTGNNLIINFVSIPAENLFLVQRSPQWITREQFNSTVEGTPSAYVVRGVDSNGDAQIEFSATPDAVYAVEIDAFVRQDDLSDDADVLQIPYQPVLNLALAMLARERGEVGGQTSTDLFKIAHQSMGDAISLDNAKWDEQLDWYVP